MLSAVEFVILVAAIFAAAAGIIIYNAIAAGKKLRSRLQAAFGKIPGREYGLEEFESISHYYYNAPIQGFEIDDITWSDLEMDSLFCRINNTQSSAGQEYLYYLLRTPEFSAEKLADRTRMMDYFRDHQEERLKIQTALKRVGRTRSFSISDYLDLLRDFDGRGKAKHIICFVAFVAALASLFINTMLGVGCILLVTVINMLVYLLEKGKMEPYMQSMQYILRLLKGADMICTNKALELKPEMDEIRSLKKNFSGFRFGSGLVITTSPMGGSLEQVFLDYFKMILHFDLIRFYQMIDYIKGHTKEIDQLIAAVGLVDAMIAGASYRETIPYYCTPVFDDSRQAKLSLKGVYHPLLEEPVANTIEESENVLLTGSNASGKSTFLKAVAINALLAQTLNISFAKEYKANYFRIYTSMALKDNLLNHESYYIVEIKSLKRILDAAKEATPMLCFVDEVLRGTNTVERISASVEILKSINKDYVICFAATHDIELTHLLEDCFHNYHFQEQITGNDIEFDYHLNHGRATSRNAIKLLGIMGYDAEIIKRAEARTYELEKV